MSNSDKYEPTSKIPRYREALGGFCTVFLIALFVLGCSEIEESRQDGLLPINGTELYVETTGRGEPIIIIHGGPVLDHGYLQPHLMGLEENHQLIYYDQRLSGRSSGDIDTSQISIDQFVADIDAIRNHFSYNKVHILGHSWGGLLAMEYAVKNSQKVKSLILMNPMPPSHSLWQEEQLELAKHRTSADSIKRQKIIQSDLFQKNKPEAIEQLLRHSFKSQFYDTTFAHTLNLYVPHDYMKRSQLFSNMAAYLGNYDLTEELTQLQVPTLIVYGSAEPAASISGPALDSLIPNSEFQIIENSGHFPFIEQEQKLNNLILEFLDDH